ncbi:MAG: biopolymer transporter ExbD [Verrucomicrobiota bacterium]
MGRHKIKKAEPEADPEFQVAPMADVLLVLLIFFMSITTSEILRNVKGIELPVAKDGKERAKGIKQVVVNISWNPATKKGEIEIDQKQYTDPQDAVAFLKSSSDLDPGMRVVVRADKGTEYSYVSEVMKACAKANISSITFSVMTNDANKKG